MRRNLAAIMVADMVGYSKLMSVDEQATVLALAEMRRTVFEPTVDSCSGRIVKSTGDGWLVEFDSVLDAINCAISLQETLSSEKTIELRLGVHLGDVMHDDDGDIFGDGVNTASRLESHAPPRGVAISDQVYNALDGSNKARFQGGHEVELKNISRPVRIWKWNAPYQSGLTTEPSVDVQPTIRLEPLSLGGDQKLAGDLALEIENGLENAISKRTGIKVTTSTNTAITPTYRLHGRCRVSGNRCRIHLSINVEATGETCWSTKTDGEITDLLGFVDTLVWQAGAAIRVHLNTRMGADYAERPIEELTGQQLLSKAAFHMHQFDARGIQASRETMAAAIAKVPDNPMALAMLSYAMMQTVPLAMDWAGDVAADEILAIADKAVELGPKVDYSFHNRARIRLWLKKDHLGCRHDAERALTINPDFHFAVEDIAVAEIFGGDIQSGVDSLGNIVRNFADHPSIPYRLAILSIGHTLLGDTEPALRHARDAFERKSAIRLGSIAYAAAASGDKRITLSPGFRRMIDRHGLRVIDAHRFPMADRDRISILEDILRNAGLPE